MRYERDEDYEAAEPAAAADEEEGDGRRLPDQASMAGETGTADEAAFDDDLVVAEVTDAEPDDLAADEDELGSPTAMPAVPQAASDTATNGQAPTPTAMTTATAATADTPPTAGDADERSFAVQEWRDIQATFVDDPHGAVQMAAAAADGALTALVSSLRARQASMDPTATQDTEQLRAALQEYRKFCQAISEVGRRLPQPAATVR